MPKSRLREVQQMISLLPKGLQREVRELYVASDDRAKDGAYYLSGTIKLADPSTVIEHADNLRWHISNFLDRAYKAEDQRESLIQNGISAAHWLERKTGQSPVHIEKMLEIARLPGLQPATRLQAVDAILDIRGAPHGTIKQAVRQHQWHAKEAEGHRRVAEELKKKLVVS